MNGAKGAFAGLSSTVVVDDGWLQHNFGTVFFIIDFIKIYILTAVEAVLPLTDSVNVNCCSRTY